MKHTPDKVSQQFLLLLLLSLLIALFPILAHAQPQVSLTTHLGTVIPHSVLQTRFPKLPSASFPHAIYHQDRQTGILHSLTHSLDPSALSSEPQRLSSPPIRITVDDIRHPDLTEDAFVRHGNTHSFMYEDITSNSLLSAWGPQFFLEPLDIHEFPNIFVNTLHNTSSPSLALHSDIHKHSARPPPARVQKPLIQDLTDEEEDTLSLSPATTTRQSDWYRSRHDFEIFAAYDSTFCAKHGGMHRTNKFIASLFKSIQGLFRQQTQINPVLKHIYGRCNPLNDPFGKPKELDECPVDSHECSRSTIILASLRKYWDIERDVRRRDAVYLFTDYDTGTHAIGAAYVGAACNPDYAYGWVGHAIAPVLAHELGHTLGAHHEPTGLMSPVLNVTNMDDLELSPNSVTSIVSFTENVWSSWCLARWDQYYQYGDTTLVGMKMGHRGLDGTDVTFAESIVPGRTDLYTLHVAQNVRNGSMYYSYTGHVHMRNGNYRYYEWLGLYQVPLKRGAFYAGGGIAYANIRSKTSRDLMIFTIRSRSFGMYKVGFGLDHEGVITPGNWSATYTMPFRLGSRISAAGITIGDVRGNGGNDLIIAFIDNAEDADYAYYVIGWNIAPDGKVRGGWSDIHQVRGWLSVKTGDISVALWDTSGNGRKDLVIHTNEKVMIEFRGVFRVGRDLDRDGVVSGVWSTSIPAPGSPLIAVLPGVTGGVALGYIPGKKNATTVVMQSVNFPGANVAVSYLEFGFDLVTAARDDVKRSFVENIVQDVGMNCVKCYNGQSFVQACEKKFVVCEKVGHAFPIEVDVENIQNGTATTNTTRNAALQLLSGRQDGNESSTTPVGLDDTIFCTGFHELFVGDEGDACRSDSGREEVVVEGTRKIIEHELQKEGYTNASVTATLEEEDAEKVLKPGERLGGPSRSPSSIVIKTTTTRSLLRQTIDKVLNELRKRPDFSNAFGKTHITKKRINGKIWVVIVRFSFIFRQTWYKDDMLVSYGSDAKLRRRS